MNEVPLLRTRHILTVSLEDYFQGAAFRKVLTQTHWSRFEYRVQQSTDRALELLSRRGYRATFFVSTWLAEQLPAVVRSVVAEGHEIGSSGLTQKSFRAMSRKQLYEAALSSKEILEQLTGRCVRGYRSADHTLEPAHLWALEVLAEAGYDYDSSLSPSFNRFKSQPHRQFLHEERFHGKKFYELPLPAFHFLGVQVPIAGGNYFRQIPEALVKRAVNSWITLNPSPFVFYFRVWDLDPNQPEITGASRLAKLRHYRNADRIPYLLETLLEGRELTGISEYLGFAEEKLPVLAGLAISPERESQEFPATVGPRTEVSIVVPCYNESHSLPYLAKALAQLEAASAGTYKFTYIFVDDGSEDGTWTTLQSVFGANPRALILRHDHNLGITASTLTGVRATRTELVCSLDCDCTYDPLELLNLIPLATSEVDCVTASPYHAQGKVLNLPVWRRTISVAASYLYRIVLGSPVRTYTSCFRVYRRSKLLSIDLRESGFVGIAEIIGLLHLGGSQIREVPSTLAVRMLGHSKMKLVRNTLRHLRLLSKLTFRRFSSPKQTSRTHVVGTEDCVEKGLRDYADTSRNSQSHSSL